MQTPHMTEQYEFGQKEKKRKGVCLDNKTCASLNKRVQQGEKKSEIGQIWCNY
jgi:archaellum component FlaC